MMKRHLPCGALVAIIAFGSATFVHAKEVTLARNANATEQAVAALIVEDLYQRADMRVDVKPMPAARANSVALDGKVDGEVGRIQAYFDRFTSLTQVKPAYYYITTTAFAKKGSGISVGSREELKRYKVGIIRGVAHTAAATEGHPNVQVVNDAAQLYKLLDAGRIDLALDAGVNGPFMAKRLGIDGMVDAGTLARLDLFLVLHPDNEGMAPALAKVVQDLKDSGELESMARQYEADFVASGAPN